MIKAFILVVVLAVHLSLSKAEGKFKYSLGPNDDSSSSIYIFLASSFNYADGLMKRLKAYAHSKVSYSCKADSDCLNKDFFCKNNICIAKRAEGSLCLSGKNEECQCGKCTSNPLTWETFCLNEKNCFNEGISSNSLKNSICLT